MFTADDVHGCLSCLQVANSPIARAMLRVGNVSSDSELLSHVSAIHYQQKHSDREATITAIREGKR
jgi:hypothetical protein